MSILKLCEVTCVVYLLLITHAWCQPQPSIVAQGKTVSRGGTNRWGNNRNSVDGNTGATINSAGTGCTGCIATAENRQAWWKVNLAGPRNVSLIRIFSPMFNNPKMPKVGEIKSTDRVPVSLYPIELENSRNTIDSYVVVVRKIVASQSRRKRNVPQECGMQDQLYNATDAADRNHTCYITAAFNSNDIVEGGTNLVVGNGSMIGGYYNAPLEENEMYAISIGAQGQLERGKNFTQFLAIFEVQSYTVPPPPQITPIVVGTVVPFIVIITAAGIFFFVRRKKSRTDNPTTHSSQSMRQDKMTGSANPTGGDNPEYESVDIRLSSISYTGYAEVGDVQNLQTNQPVYVNSPEVNQSKGAVYETLNQPGEDHVYDAAR